MWVRVVFLCRSLWNVRCHWKIHGTYCTVHGGSAKEHNQTETLRFAQSTDGTRFLFFVVLAQLGIRLWLLFLGHVAVFCLFARVLFFFLTFFLCGPRLVFFARHAETHKVWRWLSWDTANSPRHAVPLLVKVTKGWGLDTCSPILMSYFCLMTEGQLEVSRQTFEFQWSRGYALTCQRACVHANKVKSNMKMIRKLFYRSA